MEWVQNAQYVTKRPKQEKAQCNKKPDYKTPNVIKCPMQWYDRSLYLYSSTVEGDTETLDFSFCLQQAQLFLVQFNNYKKTVKCAYYYYY